MNPQKAEQEYQKAIGLHRQGKWKAAEVVYRKVHKAFPQLDSVMTNLGAVLYQQGNLEGALRYLDKAIKVNPLGKDAYTNRAAVLMGLGRLEDAKTGYERLARLDPQDAGVHYNHANLLFQTGDVNGAEKSFRLALQHNPKLIPAHFNLGYLLMQGRKIPEAEACFRKVIGLNPAHVKAYINLGNLQAERGENREARSNYALALEADPDSAMALLAFGRLQQDMGFSEEAFEMVSHALKQEANDPVAWILKGNTENTMRRYADARQSYEKALELEPGNIHAERNLKKLLRNRIPDWHFTMLGDAGRNQAYDQALRKALANGGKVLDIGTGSGLLAMMSARAGADSVVAVELVNSLASVAEKVVAKNGFQDLIKVVNVHSTTLEAEKDLGGKVDVLVSEILGVGLLDEGVLPSHRHAIQELLKPGGQVIPRQAEMFAELISVPYRRKTTPIRTVEGFDLSEMKSFQDLSQHTGMELDKEEWEGMSEVTPLWQVNFSELPDVAPEDRPDTWEQTFVATKAGAVHAVSLWFDLWLDEAIVVSSRPGGALRHWGQAVFFFDEDQEVVVGDELHLLVKRTDFNWEFEVLRKG